MRETPPKTGERVSFRLSEVVCPGVEEAIRLIGPELEVAGNVVVVSDGPTQRAEYVVVEVPGILTPMIVPVSMLSGRSGETVVSAGYRAVSGESPGVH